MLESFRAACFSDLQIGPLGAVNLIVGQNNSGKSSLLKALRRHGGLPCCYVPAEGLATDQRAEWWSRISATEREQTVLAGLRLIEPDVEKVEIEDVIPSIWMKGIHSPVTLPSLGHGTSRLFDLTLALANAAHGILLVDEIENGLHYSVQSGLWKLMVDTARRSNVQVFATTHSWDCIEAFQAALQDRHASGYLIRLNRQEQGIMATVYDQEELAIIVHDRVEAR